MTTPPLWSATRRPVTGEGSRVAAFTSIDRRFAPETSDPRTIAMLRARKGPRRKIGLYAFRFGAGG